jgi:uncharacterized OB-fold protein
MADALEYLGMKLVVRDDDSINARFFKFCADEDFHLQSCSHCGQFRYPPSTACPFCSSLDYDWTPAPRQGRVHTFTEVHHAVNPAFKSYAPYIVAIVELDHQANTQYPGAALRVVANIATPTGDIARADTLNGFSIGCQVRMVYRRLSDTFAIPMWTIDLDHTQSG